MGDSDEDSPIDEVSNFQLENSVLGDRTFGEAIQENLHDLWPSVTMRNMYSIAGPDMKLLMLFQGKNCHA